MINLLFDYDGTLHDSLRIYAPAVQTAYDRLTRLGCAPPRRWSDEEVRAWIGLPPAQMWDQCVPGLPDTEKQTSAALVGRRMLELVQAGHARLYAGVPEVLTALRQQGFRLLLLSNCPISYLRAHTEYFHLEQFFHGLFCAEQFAYRPKYEIFSRLRPRYDGTFAVIGDRIQDMEIARRNGLPAIGCLYGYGGRKELSGADWTVQAPSQLLSCVMGIPADGGQQQTDSTRS